MEAVAPKEKIHITFNANFIIPLIPELFTIADLFYDASSSTGHPIHDIHIEHGVTG